MKLVDPDRRHANATQYTICGRKGRIDEIETDTAAGNERCRGTQVAYLHVSKHQLGRPCRH